ncbi:MAG: arginine--tRNA ligase [Planctomycetia bacterium]|nr:arginine--tRNA ligase [Planctomycetia bacterium]
MNIINILKDRFEVALKTIVPEASSYLNLIRPSMDPKFGDYQANFAMPIGKALGQPPREIAQKIVHNLHWDDILEQPEIAGPGFINLKFRNDWLEKQLVLACADDRLGVVKTDSPKTIIIDFSSPNAAKPMHVGHIRSTVIGNALYQILRFCGHNVLSDNHLGDWGTQFGMIFYGYRHFLDSDAFEKEPVVELGRLYRLVRQIMDYHAAKKELGSLLNQLEIAQKQLEQFKKSLDSIRQTAEAEKSKESLKKANKEFQRLQENVAALNSKIEETTQKIEQVENNADLFQQAQKHSDISQAVLLETSKLHHGDAANRQLWKEFLPRCMKEINAVYHRLGISFDLTLGESFYHDRLSNLVDQLKKEGVAKESEGAVCIFADGYDVPMLIQKKDGAFLYATTDLATIEYRQQNYCPDEILYVVDFRQFLHFDLLFAVAKQISLTSAKLVHVKFGTILGNDNRPFKTRSGDTVGLESLLDEAERRAFDIVSANDDAKKDGATISTSERREIARKIGIGALIYSDLAQNRESDYVFSYDKMLAMNGNTATYMQYAYARVRSIFSRGNIEIEELRKRCCSSKTTDSEIQSQNEESSEKTSSQETNVARKTTSLIKLIEPTERALGLELLKFGDALEAVIQDYRPNQLTTYLFELANRYSSFFEKCPVLKAGDDSTKNSRLLLCDLTARTIQKGLLLLGIQTVEKM